MIITIIIIITIIRIRILHLISRLLHGSHGLMWTYYINRQSQNTINELKRLRMPKGRRQTNNWICTSPVEEKPPGTRSAGGQSKN